MIALVPDVKGWAWWTMAHNLARECPGEYVIVEQKDFGLWWHLAEQATEAVVFYSWASAPLRLGRQGKTVPVGVLVASEGVRYEAYDERDWNTRIVTKSRNRARAKERLPQFAFVLAENQTLAAACRNFNPKTYCTEGGVNTNLFTPGLPRERGPRLRVGWCANRKGVWSVKGFEEIMEPLMQATGDRYEWVINERDRRNALTREQMVAWYRGLDVFLCTSINDGAPTPVREAAACGVPVISTSVGMVRRWQALRELGLIVPPYKDLATAATTVAIFQRCLSRLDEDEEHRKEVATAICQSVEQHYSWKVLAPVWHRAIQEGVNG